MKKTWWIVGTSTLAALCLALLVMLVAARNDLDTSRRTLTDTRAGAVYSAAARMEEIGLTLDKALLSQDINQSRALLSDVCAGAQAVEAGLSGVRAQDGAMESTLKFVNQLSGYASSLILSGEPGEAQTLSELSDACGKLASALLSAQTSAIAPGNALPNAENAVPDAANAVEYPSLLYDGPFSDARETGVPKALAGDEITAEDALAYAKAFIGEERTLSVARGADAGGILPAYGVTVTTQEGDLQLAITRQGGHVLWMSPETVSAQAKHSEEACVQAAERFLESRGYENMRATWRQAYDGLLVASFAAEQDGVLLYPDQVKAQVRMDTLEIVGLEAHSYLMNHAPRKELTPAISPEEAQGAVSEKIAITGARLCLIPLDAQEALCYEFSGTYADNAYYVYIDALTGVQRKLLKVVSTQSGALTALAR